MEHGIPGSVRRTHLAPPVGKHCGGTGTMILRYEDDVDVQAHLELLAGLADAMDD